MNKSIIAELVLQAENDLGAAEALKSAGYYGHALFWAHLVLEKLCKAVWVKMNNNEEYPHLHNLIKLLTQADIKLNEEQIIFFSDMNQFQAKGRYADELEVREKTVTRELCELYFVKINIQIVWLKNLLQ